MFESSRIFLDITRNVQPDIAVILGSGLTNFFDNQNILHTISYKNLPEFPQPTIKGHAGIGAIYIIYLRESMEINTFIFMNTGDTLSQKIIGAGIATIIVVAGIPLLMKHKLIQKNMFSITRYAFLLFGILFSYEAIEHII